MRLPHRIDFGVAVIPIRQVGKREMREIAECDEDDVTPDGLWDGDDGVIYLLKTAPNRQKREVLFHEIVHAANDHTYWMARMA